MKPTIVNNGKPFGEQNGIWYTFFCPTCKRQIIKNCDCENCKQKINWK